jgi:Lrp/AsnC family transcriptional regulator for asnA, asnC and gidA
MALSADPLQPTSATPPDALERGILREVRRDPAITHRELARRLCVSERAARARLRRMLDTGVLDVVTMVNMQAAGLRLLTTIGIHVRGRASLDVARDVALVGQVLAVNVVIGDQDLEIMVASPSARELSELLLTAIGEIPGVEALTVGIAVRVLKHDVVWRPAAGCDAIGSTSQLDASGVNVSDPLDRQLIGCLMRDSRSTTRSLAQHLSLSETAVRMRRRRLVAAQVIRTAIVLHGAFVPAPSVAYYWISVAALARLAKVATSVAALPQLTFVAIMSGRCDILAVAPMDDRSELLTLHDTILGIDGVHRVRHSLGQQIVKFDARWCAVPDVPRGEI